MYDKKNYVVHMKDVQLVLDYRLILEKVHRVTLFNQEPWLKTNIDINTELRTKPKMILKITFLN